MVSLVILGIKVPTFWGVISYSTDCWRPWRIRFSEIVSRSLAARIESIMVVNDASTSVGTVFQLVSADWSRDLKGRGREGRGQAGVRTYKTFWRMIDLRDRIVKFGLGLTKIDSILSVEARDISFSVT